MFWVWVKISQLGLEEYIHAFQQPERMRSLKTRRQNNLRKFLRMMSSKKWHHLYSIKSESNSWLSFFLTSHAPVYFLSCKYITFCHLVSICPSINRQLTRNITKYMTSVPGTAITFMNTT